MSNDRFDKLESKVDRLDERLDTITVVLDRNTNSLQEHMRRSDANEAAIEEVKKAMSPVVSHVQRITWAVRGIFWFVSILAAAALLAHQLGILK
jgi:hypothetical protein